MVTDSTKLGKRGIYRFIDEEAEVVIYLRKGKSSMTAVPLENTALGTEIIDGLGGRDEKAEQINNQYSGYSGKSAWDEQNNSDEQLDIEKELNELRDEE